MAASILSSGSGNGASEAGNPSGAGAGAGDAPPPPLKPLEELTEADIRQLTREDCRRYLKERGMRRPSWNKAQAIQQVLSLRSLLCPLPLPSLKSPAASVSRTEVAAADAHANPLPDKVSEQITPDSSPSNNADPRPAPVAAPCFSPTLPVFNPDPKLNSLSSRAASPHRAQLTIFYSGIVNVYDDVPLDKAQAIMLLAASKTFQVPSNPVPMHSPSSTHQQQIQQQHHQQNQNPQQQNHQQQTEFRHQEQTTQKYQLQQPQATPMHQISAPGLREECSAESGLPQVRSVSLQRFLAKRRDRLSGNPRRSELPKRRKLFSSPPRQLTSVRFLSDHSRSSPSSTSIVTTATATATATTTTTTTTTAMITAGNDQRCSSFKQASENSNASASSDHSGENSRVLDDNGRLLGS